MAVDKLKYSIGNAASTTLAVAMSNTDTSGTLTSDTNFAAKSGEGMVLIDESAATEEVAYATGKSGSALTIPLANRGLEGGSAQPHSIAATVKGILTAGMWNDLIDSMINVLDKTTGALDTTKVVDLTTAQTLTNKRLTSPKLNENVALTSTATELNLLHGVTALPSSDGWVSSSDTWTYASATSFTIAGADRTTVFTKGTRIKLTQTSAKYFVVTSSSFSTDTTVNITGGSDYSLANATISSPYYSYASNPQGYPGWFNWTPTFGGFSAAPASPTTRFRVIGTSCLVKVNTGLGTSNATTFSISAPITSAATGGSTVTLSAQVANNSLGLTTPGNAYIFQNSSTINLEKDGNGGTWTNSGTKSAAFFMEYEI